MVRLGRETRLIAEVCLAGEWQLLLEGLLLFWVFTSHKERQWSGARQGVWQMCSNCLNEVIQPFHLFISLEHCLAFLCNPIPV